jgi:hypothetical protein
MNGIELLEKYSKAATVIKQWFLERMLESLKDETLPETFKEYARQQEIDNDKIGKLIDGNPRTLFDVFDENDLSINIVRTPNRTEGWEWEIMQESVENSICKSRKEAELLAIEAAFKLLNEKL